MAMFLFARVHARAGQEAAVAEWLIDTFEAIGTEQIG